MPCGATVLASFLLPDVTQAVGTEYYWSVFSTMFTDIIIYVSRFSGF